MQIKPATAKKIFHPNVWAKYNNPRQDEKPPQYLWFTTARSRKAMLAIQWIHQYEDILRPLLKILRKIKAMNRTNNSGWN